MGDNENKGFALIAEAEKKLKSSKTFLGGLFGSTVELETPSKWARSGPEAGNTFVTLAGHHTKMGNKHDAATNFVDAAQNCYKKTDPQEAANCLNKAVVIYTDMGRFSIAAKHLQNIAEIYENDVADLERAMQHYEQAADCFRIDESNSSANKCMLKVAQYAAQLENYERAIRIYEQHSRRYEEQYPAFADSRESKLIKSLLVHIEDQDIDAFYGGNQEI
ncbi:NAPA [Lepeophtheirus salmonis]|uniref:NAPA n=1 Tax=Lepeophtheirus salmonis TaxID=72036 RepID=A0A7R8CJ98_LEPSM|nr:NAPA [Lepeophtheirus salmonis]CAF2840211.1 NAPA [Lepeophtheirus salmonis]